jgi:UDP-N-acetylmuramoyl-L-alanyl-D-glutamate--2,6-diaminopimelate ligase
MSDGLGLRLDELLRELPAGSELSGDGSVRVLGVHQDSRRVSEGDLFVALKGGHADGASFIEAARTRGAVALLTDLASHTPDGVPCIRVADTRVGIALASAAVYGHPAFSLEIIGITGTNGKTTTAHLVRAAIDGATGHPSCGLIGTVGHSFGDLNVAASHTTPEADDLARFLLAMRERGATHVAMEVSSIALTSRRVHAIRFRVAAFTNLTQDHLDYHGTMADYAAAKAELFTTYVPGSAVIHVGDPFGRELASRVKAPLVRVSAAVGTPVGDAEIAPLTLSLSARGIAARVRTPRGAVDLVSPLFGAHNLENLLVSLGIVVALDLDVSRATEALRHELGAPGRRNELPIELAKPIGEGLRVAGVSEVSPADLASVAKGYVIELDRGRAIEAAVLAASPGDVVVVCGKGHENYQVFGDQSFPFDDRVEARRALAERRDRAQHHALGAP